MLQANKAQLLAQINLNTLDLRQSELKYWVSTFSKFGSLAALLSGFASRVMLLNSSTVSISSNQSSQIKVDTLPHLLYILFTSSAFGSNLFLLTICTMCW